MGYNDEFVGMRALFMDCETVPIDDVQDYLEEPSAPEHYVKQDAIDRYIAKAKASQIKKAALRPDLARLVCLSWMAEEDTTVTVHLCRDAHEELTALIAFFDALHTTFGPQLRRVLTFNGHKFDLPMILRRSLALKVPNMRMLPIHRGSPHLDLLRLLSFDYQIDYYSLDFYLKRYAIDAGVQDPFSGADIDRLVSQGQWDAVKHHNECDVLKLRALSEWMGVTQPATVEATAPAF